MWSDNETSVDLLGFSVHSGLIQAVVTDPKLLPVTVGVFGDWGSGKSSVMKMLKEQLEEKDRVACIYFNGWQFEGYEEAKSALVHSVLLELSKNKKLIPKAREKVDSLLSKIDWLRLADVGYQTIVAPVIAGFLASQMGAPVAPVLKSSAPQAPSSAASVESDLKSGLQTAQWKEIVKRDSQSITGIRQFRDDFRELIEETGLSAIVILVDDLDRCTPERLVETLEAIKLFLAVPQVAFVIGADERIVRYAIAKRYETEAIVEEEHHVEQAADLVTDYLEKLIQIPYYLPRLSPSEIETYMSLLFCEYYLTGELFGEVYKAFQHSRREDITSTFGQQEIQMVLASNDTSNEELESYLSWCSMVAPAFSDILKGNPRQTKRLLNALVLRKKLAEAARLDSLSDQVLVKLMLLVYSRPQLFNQLYQWQASQDGYPREIALLETYVRDEDEEAIIEAEEFLEQNDRWKDTSVKQWLQMPPALGDRDLRNYFWITRDRITGIESGLATIPRYLRQLVFELAEVNEDSILTGEIQSQLKRLSKDDRRILLDELAQLFKREEDKRNLVQAWFLLIDDQIVPEALDRFLILLKGTGLGEIPPNAPTKLEKIFHRHPDYEERVIQLLQKWSGERSVSGLAADEILKTLKGDTH
jgi:predicted KAP-like P-loop ATPase